MKAKIQVLSVEKKSGIAKASGRSYEMNICQCVVHGDKVLVGELVLPKDHPLVEPGFYEGEFGIAIDGQTKRIGGQLLGLYKAPSEKPASNKSAAAAA